jgi:hypothetical protein
MVPAKKRWEPDLSRRFERFSGGGEREFVVLLFGQGMTMRAARAAGLGAGTQRFVDDGLDGARAAAAFGAAAEASINLLGIARHTRSCTDGIADIMVAEDVTGTDNHEVGRPFGDPYPLRY